jgi:hypothetical protein
MKNISLISLSALIVVAVSTKNFCGEGDTKGTRILKFSPLEYLTLAATAPVIAYPLARMSNYSPHAAGWCAATAALTTLAGKAITSFGKNRYNQLIEPDKTKYKEMDKYEDAKKQYDKDVAKWNLNQDHDNSCMNFGILVSALHFSLSLAKKSKVTLKSAGTSLALGVGTYLGSLAIGQFFAWLNEPTTPEASSTI